ncbi:MAG: aldehyde ferredoxin oxidoreductase C-terminal domain-containing protein [Eubacteriales bacterium]|nr:aldehyde ferredoxin oxidoreductase C-terminal domain-containing protein [Eubacteriales bacterium]
MDCKYKEILETQIKDYKREQIAQSPFESKKIDKGYADRTLYINIGEKKAEIKTVSSDMREKFTGGRGYGMKLLWDAVNSDTKWNSPENEIVIAQGPIGGITQYPGSGKTYVATISPLTDIPIDSNVGGHFGPLFKLCGFDALEIQGKSETQLVIFIDGENGMISFEKYLGDCEDSHILAEVLTDVFSISEDDKKNVSIISAGSAAGNTNFGILNFSYYDIHRKHTKLKQAGRGGIGTVFVDKNIKAVVVRKPGMTGDMNNVADYDKVARTGIRLHRELHDNDGSQANMRLNGTTRLVEAMNDYDLVPVNNFRYGYHPDAYKMRQQYWQETFTQGIPDGCWYGCTMQCSKSVSNVELKTGPYKGHKVLIDGPEYETAAGVGTNCGIYDPHAVLECNFYCDTYGIDTISFGTTCAFLMECFEENLIDVAITGGLELHFGNWTAQLELLHQMSRGEGFGTVAGLGVKKLKEIFVDQYGIDADYLNDIGMECKGLEYSEYVTKESLAQQAGYGTANKGAQHDENWLIFMDMVNNQIPTFEDKAEALYFYPLFRTWFSLVGLCKLPWNDIEPANNAETDEPAKVPEHIENYINLYNGVTGANVQHVSELVLQSERVYNLQKVFNLKMGKGLRRDDAIPYRSVGPVTIVEYRSRMERYDKQLKELGFDIKGKTIEEKMGILRKHRENQYEMLLDAVYNRRGWTNNAVPMPETLQRLGIDYPEVLEVVNKHLC